ncbi:MAG: molybdenum cofactor biosynthesis protein B [Arenicella sp.]
MDTHTQQSNPFIALNIVVLTVSDSRDETTDTAGKLLCESLLSAGHAMKEKYIVKDDVYQLRAVVSKWIADAGVHAILTTGGTGFTERDNTPEALMPLFDKQVEGFGELFRHISYADIGTSTLQSRAFAGMANRTLIACMPGSPNACRMAWEGILKDQLNHSNRPCNFAEHIKPPNNGISDLSKGPDRQATCCDSRS